MQTHRAETSGSAMESLDEPGDRQSQDQQKTTAGNLKVTHTPFQMVAQTPFDAEPHGGGDLSQPVSVPSPVEGGLRVRGLGFNHGAQKHQTLPGRGVLSDDSESAVAAAFL